MTIRDLFRLIIEHKKILSAFTLLLGVLIYLPYFWYIGYLPEISLKNGYISLLMLLFSSLFYLVLIPSVFIFPLVVINESFFTNQDHRERESLLFMFFTKFVPVVFLSSSIFVSHIRNDENAWIVVPSTILLIVVGLCLILLGATLAEKRVEDLWNGYICTFLFGVPLTVLMTAVAEYEETYVMTFSDSVLSLYGMFVAYLLIFFGLTKAIRKVATQWGRTLFMFFSGWSLYFILALVVQAPSLIEGDSKKMIQILASPAGMSLKVFGKGGGIKKNLNTNRSFCESHEDLKPAHSCDERNVYKNVRVWWSEPGSAYVEFEAGRKFELNINHDFYMSDIEGGEN